MFPTRHAGLRRTGRSNPRVPTPCSTIHSPSGSQASAVEASSLRRRAQFVTAGGCWSRHAVDLADPAARDAFLTEELAGVTKALRRPKVAWWMLDFSGPDLQMRMNKRTRGMLDRTPFKFAPQNGVAFFEDLGCRL